MKLVVLRCILATTFSAFTLAEANATSSYSKRDASLYGKIFSGHPLFQVVILTKIGCAAACTKRECCVGFSTTPVDPASKKMTCRGHILNDVKQLSTVAAAGSRTYLIKDRIRAQELEAWLERPCAKLSDCPATVANVVCFAGHCLCQPGYYFSHCGQSCVTECSSQNLHSKFVRYPKLDRYKDDLMVIDDCYPLTQIPRSCLDNVDCRAFDSRKGACFVQFPNSTGPGSKFSLGTADYTYYQRTCL